VRRALRYGLYNRGGTWINDELFLPCHQSSVSDYRSWVFLAWVSKALEMCQEMRSVVVQYVVRKGNMKESQKRYIAASSLCK
jgi:hypothetical protein